MQKNTSGYSILVAILVVGVMFLLTSAVFALVMNEFKDTKSLEFSYKSFEGAQGAVELGLLKAKEFTYTYSGSLKKGEDLSEVLHRGSTYNKNKDVTIVYDIDGITDKISDKDIASGDFAIIPLFYKKENGDITSVTNLSLHLAGDGSPGNVVWNILGPNQGMAGTGNFDNTSTGTLKTVSNLSGELEIGYSNTKTVNDMLQTEKKTELYLILHNTNNSEVSYTLTTGEGEYISKDITTIVGSGDVGGYKQNLQVKIDTSQFLHLLKYSIFSPEIDD